MAVNVKRLGKIKANCKCEKVCRNFKKYIPRKLKNY